MNKKTIGIFLLVFILTIGTTVFGAIRKVAFSFDKFTMSLGTTQSISGIMSVYGHEIDYSNFTITDRSVIDFTTTGKSLYAVGTGIADLKYTFLDAKGEVSTITCHVEVNTTAPIPGSNTDVYYTITLNSVDTVSKMQGKRGLKPTLPELTREGYTFAGWYLDPEFNTKYELNWLRSDLNLYAKWVEGNVDVNAPIAPEALYSDIENHWAKGKIEYVTREGIFNGTGSDKFSPDTPMTRAMVVTVLGRIAEVKDEGRTTKFTDVPEGAYFEEYVSWAVENGIASGVTATEFNPHRNITREELAVMIANYIKYTKKDYGEVEEIDYLDNNEISDWAVEAVKELNSYNVMKGNTDGNFLPKKEATRAELAVVFFNYYMIKG